ncbi:hypothetical protein Tco_0887926 [Tanacetum coccineum]
MTYPCHWFSEHVGIAGDLGSTNDVLIPLIHTAYSNPLNTAYSNPLNTAYRSSDTEVHDKEKLSKTRSLDYLSSPEFNFIFDLEDQFEEDETKEMGETMDEYMCKTRGDYGSGIARPKIDNKAQLINLGREIKKVNEKGYAAKVGYDLCKGPHYTNDCPLKEEGKPLEEAYYTQFGVPFPQRGQYRVAALRFYQRNNGNPSYQERRQTMEKSLSKFMVESVKRQEENSNLIKEIRASTDAAIRNQGASIKALEI